MQLTILQTGDVPAALGHRFGPYPDMFRRMFEAVGVTFGYTTIRVHDGAPLPDPRELEAVLITGSAAGVYDDLPWLDPLRQFIRSAYRARLPMVGICFGHQIMADALGGDVRKSEKGWGLGRHVYEVRRPHAFPTDLPAALAVACSHQDQVITPPPAAEVVMASAFTPNAALLYRSGRALSLQAHPEFDDDYSIALAELRRGRAPDAVVDAALASMAIPSHSSAVARYLGAFLSGGV